VFPRSFGSGARPRPQQLGLFGRVPSVMTVGLLRSHRIACADERDCLTRLDVDGIPLRYQCPGSFASVATKT
jgi:hypothetical protein